MARMDAHEPPARCRCLPPCKGLSHSSSSGRPPGSATTPASATGATTGSRIRRGSGLSDRCCCGSSCCPSTSCSAARYRRRRSSPLLRDAAASSYDLGVVSTRLFTMEMPEVDALLVFDPVADEDEGSIPSRPAIAIASFESGRPSVPAWSRPLPCPRRVSMTSPRRSESARWASRTSSTPHGRAVGRRHWATDRAMMRREIAEAGLTPGLRESLPITAPQDAGRILESVRVGPLRYVTPAAC